MLNAVMIGKYKIVGIGSQAAFVFWATAAAGIRRQNQREIYLWKIAGFIPQNRGEPGAHPPKIL